MPTNSPLSIVKKHSRPGGSIWDSHSYSRSKQPAHPVTGNLRTKFLIDPDDLVSKYNYFCLETQIQPQPEKVLLRLATILINLRATPADYFQAQLFWYQHKLEHPWNDLSPVMDLVDHFAIQRYKTYIRTERVESFCSRIELDSVPRMAERLEYTDEDWIDFLVVVINDPFYAVVHPALNKVIRDKHYPEESRFWAGTMIANTKTWILIHGKDLLSKFEEARNRGLISYQNHPKLSLL